MGVPSTADVSLQDHGLPLNDSTSISMVLGLAENAVAELEQNSWGQI
jgi:hypothetical protein